MPPVGAPPFQVGRQLHFLTLDFFSGRAGDPLNQDWSLRLLVSSSYDRLKTVKFWRFVRSGPFSQIRSHMLCVKQHAYVHCNGFISVDNVWSAVLIIADWLHFLMSKCAHLILTVPRNLPKFRVVLEGRTATWSRKGVVCYIPVAEWLRLS